jgi:hypothetical protein
MKPSYTTTLSRCPQGKIEKLAVGHLTHVTELCFHAFRLDIKISVFSVELQRIFDDDSRERIVRETFRATRMVAFISYHGNHACLEITFSEGKIPVKILRVRYDYDLNNLALVSEMSL